ncbi:DDE-domain-containing protein, partial [Didymella exigua CBS 183.55]
KITTQLVITGAERRGRPKTLQPGNREWVTLIAAISAAGWSVPPFLIFAGQYHLSAYDNGWTNNELRVEWLKHFNAHTQARSIGARRLLIIDGHKSHQSLAFQELCKENNIYTLSSARRRRSKRRIQKHGVLTKGAGEDILAQNEADQQIAHEERQGGARSGLSQRA